MADARAFTPLDIKLLQMLERGEEITLDPAREESMKAFKSLGIVRKGVLTKKGQKIIDSLGLSARRK